MSDWTYIADIDENYAPPEKPLLRVSVIGDLVSLAIETRKENRKTVTFEEQAQIVVPLAAVIAALAGGQWDEVVRDRHREKRSA